MKLPFVSHRRHDAVLADRERIRGERDQFAKDRDTFKAAARTSARHAQPGRSVQDVLEEHDVHRKALADALGEQKRHLNWDQLIAEVDRLSKVVDQLGRAEGSTLALQRRIAHLEKQLDDALGLNTPAVEDGKRWQARRMDKPGKGVRR